MVIFTKSELKTLLIFKLLLLILVILEDWIPGDNEVLVIKQMIMYIEGTHRRFWGVGIFQGGWRVT